MENVYAFMDAVLPFSWVQFTFMKNALLATLLICPLLAILGTMVTLSRMAFFADSLSHGSFTGIALGAIVGLSSPRLSLAVFAAVFALVIVALKRKSRVGTDTVIGVFSSAAMALGLMLMSVDGSFNKFGAFLIGDLLAVKGDDLAALAVVFVVTLGIWFFLFNALFLATGVNAAFAQSRGVKSAALESVFAVLLALIVAVSIEWVGVLIINALLVVPAAAAANVSSSVRQYHFFSCFFALLAGVTGLMASFYLGTAAGAAIALTAAMIFFATLFWVRADGKASAYRGNTDIDGTAFMTEEKPNDEYGYQRDKR